ncbi:hypothetical protein AT959_12855 [Dechloromonas denitrificans]|uniref:MSHA biogenesis protein MshI n=1 Tax=Dechloromonas denitrificans TaxID=281362 RepID=A0A133XH24_9RHOO|nr:PilN domain-containing protein [Dechloromonas denitrificans]KXB30243.1 hypothetical protein AT959_12855 [Dechloromonas denitrificans]
MSQQINLLLPELRPRFDWLALPVVAAATLLALLLLLALAQSQSMRVARLKAEEATLNGQLLNLRQQVQALGQVLGNRQPNAALLPEIDYAKTGVAQRQEVLDFIGRHDKSQGGGFLNILQGFSRQALDGVWLVAFGLSPDGVEIRGRLVDPALLPAYISRLNADPAFAGRRFAALEMKGVDPAAEKPEADRTAAAKPVGKRYTEFVLRTELAPPPEKTP